MCVTFWGFVIQKIIGEDDSNLTNTVETMLKPPTIVRECELFKETRFISDQSLQLKDALNGRHGGLDDGKKTLNPSRAVLYGDLEVFQHGFRLKVGPTRPVMAGLAPTQGHGYGPGAEDGGASSGL